MFTRRNKSLFLHAYKKNSNAQKKKIEYARWIDIANNGGDITEYASSNNIEWKKEIIKKRRTIFIVLF